MNIGASLNKPTRLVIVALSAQPPGVNELCVCVCIPFDHPLSGHYPFPSNVTAKFLKAVANYNEIGLRMPSLENASNQPLARYLMSCD